MNLITLESWLSSYYSHLWFFSYASGIVLFSIIENLMPLRDYVCPVIKRSLTNFSLLVINSATQRFVLPIFPVTAAIYAAENSVGVFNVWIASPIIIIFLSFLILDLFGYWLHKLMHYNRFLWRIHHTHHTDIDFDATTGFRFHPFEALLTTCMEIALVVLFGIPVIAVMLFSLIHIFTGLFTHLNIRIAEKLDSMLRLIIVTPNMHRIHHSVRVNESLSNYGIVLSIWDRLFKSYLKAPKKGYKEMLLGLENRRNPEKTMLFEFLILPFKPGY